MDRKQTSGLTRRDFSRQVSAVIAINSIIPLGALLATLPRVATATNVSESAPHAKALRYARRSAKTGQNCANCTLFKKNGARQSGQCPLFSGETVAAEAWCSAWVPRA